MRARPYGVAPRRHPCDRTPRRWTRSVPSGDHDSGSFSDLRVDGEVVRQSTGAAQAETETVARGVTVLQGERDVSDAWSTVFEGQSQTTFAFVDDRFERHCATSPVNQRISCQ